MRKRSKLKFSPKLQSSSLDDIKRFVRKDALNTPVISSYNTLPVSETPYIDQSEFTNTNPSFGVYANGPQQGRNRRPFGPTYRTQNPEYKNGGEVDPADPNKKEKDSARSKSNLKELLDASVLHGPGEELNYQMTGDKNLDDHNLHLLNARFKHLNKRRTEAYADSSEFKTMFDKHLGLLDSIEHARVDYHNPRASKWTPKFVSDTPTVDNNLLQAILKGENEVSDYDSEWINDAGYYLSSRTDRGRNKVHTDVPFVRNDVFTATKNVADTLGYGALKDVISGKKGVDNAVKVKSRLTRDTEAVAPTKPIPWTLKTTAPIKSKDTPTSEPVVEPVVEPIKKTMATSRMEHEERPGRDIKMPGGTWSKERYIERYGQAGWDAEDKARLRVKNKYQNGGQLPKYQMAGVGPDSLNKTDFFSEEEKKAIIKDKVGEGGKANPIISDGQNVGALQRSLNNIYPDLNLSTDGNWGPKTARAYQRFKADQYKKGNSIGSSLSSVTSIAGDIIRKQLNERTGLEYRPSPRTENHLSSEQLDVMGNRTRKALSEGRKFIDYPDYETASVNDAYYGRESTTDVAEKMLTDPAYQMKTTLGRSDIVITPEFEGLPSDTLVVDGYDFNPGSYGMEDSGNIGVRAAWEKSSGGSAYKTIRDLGQYLGSKPGDPSSRQSIINIGS